MNTTTGSPASVITLILFWPFILIGQIISSMSANSPTGLSLPPLPTFPNLISGGSPVNPNQSSASYVNEERITACFSGQFAKLSA